jgi:predicted glycoside hydrolase/deacetylase ChbG (UPF0249 family)
MKRLIVNADDFGLSISVNDGIVRAHTDGIVTSTSLMVRQPAAEAAAAAARTLPGLSVGLHVDIAEWERHGDAWRTLYEWAAPDDPEAVRTEVQAQLERFERLLGRMPTHLDSHQHLHRSEPLRSTLLAIASTQRWCWSGSTTSGGPAPSPERIQLPGCRIAEEGLEPPTRRLSVRVSELA